MTRQSDGAPTPGGIQAIWLDTDMMGRHADDAPPLSAEFRATAARLIARYPAGQSRSALLPLLYLAQAEHSRVSRIAIREIADLLDLTRAEVTAVATFYTMFKRDAQGTWLVSVCTQPSCALAGGLALKERLEHELGIGCGQTTADGVVSLEEVECLCVCDGAPVLSVNYENYLGMTPDDAVALVRGLREGAEPPASSSGEPPAPFAEVNRRMTGIDGPAPVARSEDR